MIVIANSFLAQWLDEQLNISGGGRDWHYGLFTNDYIPTSDSVEGDFVIPTWPSYGFLTVNDWSTPVVTDGVASTTAAIRTWTNDGATTVNIYGYFVVPDGFSLVIAERDTNSPIILTPGSSYSVIPYFSKRSYVP